MALQHAKCWKNDRQQGRSIRNDVRSHSPDWLTKHRADFSCTVLQGFRTHWDVESWSGLHSWLPLMVLLGRSHHGRFARASTLMRYLPLLGRVERIWPMVLFLPESHGDGGIPVTSRCAPSLRVFLNLICQVSANKQGQIQVMPLRAVALGTYHSVCQHFSVGAGSVIFYEISWKY